MEENKEKSKKEISSRGIVFTEEYLKRRIVQLRKCLVREFGCQGNALKLSCSAVKYTEEESNNERLVSQNAKILLIISFMNFVIYH